LEHLFLYGFEIKILIVEPFISVCFCVLWHFGVWHVRPFYRLAHVTVTTYNWMCVYMCVCV